MKLVSTPWRANCHTNAPSAAAMLWVLLLVCACATAAGQGDMEMHAYPAHIVWPAPEHMQVAHEKRAHDEHGPEMQNAPSAPSTSAIVHVDTLQLVLGSTAASLSCSAILIAGFDRLLAGAFGATAGERNIPCRTVSTLECAGALSNTFFCLCVRVLVPALIYYI